VGVCFAGMIRRGYSSMNLLEQFRFVDPGPLIDRELELVIPEERWIDGLLHTLHHPLTRQLAPRDAELTREQITRFVRDFPLGRQNAEPEKGMVPAYHYWMRLRPEFGPSVAIAGGIALRVSHTRNLEMYLGQVGYIVHPPARGHRYAQRALQLLFPLARRMGLNPLWVTCNPDNIASRLTCERAGGKWVEIVTLPPDHALHAKGERLKCRYRFDL
jgi:predicted acetyltransferase